MTQHHSKTAHPSRPVLVFRYRRGRVTPFILAGPRRAIRLEPLPTHHASPQEAAIHFATTFPGCILTADEKELAE